MNEYEVATIEAWLESLPFTLWASWDLSQPERRRLAAEWFFSEMKQLDQWVNDVT